MRVKSRWFKGEREKTPQEIAGALAFIVWRISDNALKNMRKADFDIAIGPQYFAFLSEFLIFLVQVADRIVYTRLSEEARYEFTSVLANRVADNFAENQAEWLGGALGEYKHNFIDRLNQRAGEYAEFEYSRRGHLVHLRPLSRALHARCFRRKGQDLGDRPTDGHRSARSGKDAG